MMFKVSNAAERKEKFAIMEKKMKEYEENIRKLQMEQNALKTQIKKIEDEKKKQALKIEQLEEHNMQLNEQLLVLESIN